ncbi:Sas10 C-terminal domain-containing protein [Gaertneriomyces semiglobifer]|nr:Sas10 C-terminal domain-containing protein [Gaertneriomyces semiglobifer]
MGRKKGRKGKATLERPVERVQDYRVGASANLDDLGLDDEDAFHLQREKIGFDDNFGRRHDDDDEDEEVLGLDMSDSDDHEEDDEDAEFDQSISDIVEDDEDDQDVALLKKLKFNIKAPLDSDDDEEGRGKTKKDDFDDRAWGKSRGIYYDADEASEEEDAKAEEEEARRLQKLQASQLGEEDFMDDLDDTFGARLADKAGAYGTAGMDEDTLHDDENEFDHLALSSANSLPVHLLSAPASEVHVVQRATSNLSVEERRKIAEATIPEIVQLVELFSARWQELRELLGPTLKWQCIPDPDSSALPCTPKQYARHYLELKYRLITMYLTNVAFYLSLRANPPPGANVKAHPVVETLVNIQELLDQLETRVEGNVVSDDDSDDVVESDEDESAKRKRRKRKRKLKRQMKKGFPVLLGWVNKWNSGDISESNDEESLADDMDERTVSVQVHQEAAAFSERKKSRKGKASKSNDAPPKAQKKKKEISVDIPDYTPLKPKRNKFARQTNGILGDFGESRDIDDVDMEDKLAKKRSLQFHVTRVDQAIHSRQARKLKSGAGDDDIPYRDANGKLIQPGIARVDEPKQPLDVGTVQDFFKRDVKRDNADLSEHDDDDDGLDYNAIADAAAAEAEAEKKASKKRSRSDSDADSDEEDPEEYYARIVQSKQAAASEREEMHEALRQARTEEVLSTRALLSTDNDLNENSKRLASYKILANKGLTPHRSKEQRNPRVKRRKRYEKATKRLGSFKRVVKDRRTVNVDGYAGEKTGIKKNLSRSVRFAG